MSLDIMNLAQGAANLPTTTWDALWNIHLPDAIVMSATLAGAWSMFPDPPKILQKHYADPKKQELMKWAAVALLLYQGGSGQDVGKTAVGVLSMYALREVLDMYF